MLRHRKQTTAVSLRSTQLICDVDYIKQLTKAFMGTNTAIQTIDEYKSCFNQIRASLALTNLMDNEFRIEMMILAIEANNQTLFDAINSMSLDYTALHSSFNNLALLQQLFDCCETLGCVKAVRSTLKMYRGAAPPLPPWQGTVGGAACPC